MRVEAFVAWAVDTFAPSRDDRFLALAPLHFDLSLFDILVSLSVGARVHVPGEATLSFPAEIVRVARQERTTILYTVPTVLQMVTQLRGASLPDLRWLLFAGETMPQETLGKLAPFAPNARCANLYGPTETNVVTWHEITDADRLPGAPPLPIGRSCAHCRVWVADEYGEPVPHGTTGEICVEGPTVTPGYWQLPALTLACRVTDGCTTFRTGDAGWQAADGTLHFSGRRDQQVKVRGSLVNLAELEAVAMQSGQLTAVAATLHEPGTLRAHIDLSVVPRGEPDERTLRTFLTQHLPTSYLPKHIRFLDTVPQTLNGKTDKQALGRPDVSTSIGRS